MGHPGPLALHRALSPSRKSHRPSTASTTRPEISISHSEVSMRSRRSGRRARLMTNTWRRQGGRGSRGEAAGGGESPPPDPGPAGREDSPHQTPSCWASLGAGTHEPRPTWGAHPLQRKARCHESPLAQVSSTLESQAPLIPAPLAGCPGDHRLHLPPLFGGAD